MEVITPGQGANGDVEPPPPPATVDSELLIRHLVSVLELTLGASREDLEGKGSLLSNAKRNDTVQRCLRFASEAQVALYVQKDTIPAEASNGLPNGHDRSGKTIILFASSMGLTKPFRTRYPIALLAVL
jgi:dynein heavy chain 1